MVEKQHMVRKGGKRTGSGRKPYEPTEEEKKLVYTWKGRGVSDDHIARKLDIALVTLKKYFRRELDLGEVDANALIGGAIFQNAMNGNFGAQKWWSQVRMGWKETQHIDVTSSDGSMSPLAEGKLVSEILKQKLKSKS